MDMFPLLFGAAFGIGLVVGMLHLVIGLARPRSPVHLAIAASALVFSLQALASLAMSQAATLSQYIALFKYAFGPTSVFGMLTILWFVAFYTRVRPTRFLLALTIFSVFLLLAHLLLPKGILVDITAIRRAILPWGEAITLHQGAVTPWRPAVILWLLVAYGFFAYAFFRQWQRGERLAVLLITLPVAVLFLVTTIHGRLVDTGAIDSPYLGGVSTVALFIPLSLRLAHDAILTRRALRESEQRLRAFVTGTQEGIWTVDFARPLPLDLSPLQQVQHLRRYAGTFSDSNDGMARILGYKNRREVIGRPLLDFFPLSLPANKALLEQIVDAGFRLNSLVATAVGRQGTTRYVESSLTPFVEDGQIVSVWGVSRDVTERVRTAEALLQQRAGLEEMVGRRTTELQQANDSLSQEVAERRQAEEALQQSRQFIRAILDSLPHQVVVLDKSGNILEVNEAWRRAGGENGLAWEDYGLGRNYLEVVDRAAGNGATEEAAASANGIRAVLAGERDDFWLEYPCHSPDEQRWFTMSVSRFLTEEARAVVTHQEITERVLAEKALQQREELLRQVLDLLPVGVWITDATGQIVSGNPAGLQIWGGARYVGPEEFGEYKGWWADTGQRIAPEEWAAARAIARGETSIGELIEIEAFDGSRKVILNSAVPLRGEEGEIIGTIIVNEDITNRRQVEVALQRRVQELLALHKIAGTLATLSDLLQGLPDVAETVTDLFQVDSTHLILTQYGAGELTLMGFDRARGQLAPAPVGLTLSETPLMRQVLQEQRPLVVTSESPAETSVRGKAFLQSRNISSFMVVPLLLGGSSVGVMSVNSTEADRAFTPEEVQLAETIAADIAAAVANLHLLERTQEAAALEERQRIASDLHDSVTQTIYSVSIMAEGLVRLVEQQKLAEAQRNAGQLRLMTLSAVAEMRTLLFELRPSVLAEASLPVLLQQLGDVLTGRWRVPVDVVVVGEIRLTAEVKLAFYRIAQEAFNNIAKHAEATRVAVSLRGSAEAVEMMITDDGRGFDPASDFPGRMGLRIMGERAEDVGARLQIDSQPGWGTKITLSWKVG